MSEEDKIQIEMIVSRDESLSTTLLAFIDHNQQLIISRDESTTDTKIKFEVI
ncbi:MAG: hypothetical protein ACRC6E_01730 [Fusobacteriaceae bacterium]